jgi:hypothetical protein
LPSSLSGFVSGLNNPFFSVVTDLGLSAGFVDERGKGSIPWPRSRKDSNIVIKQKPAYCQFRIRLYWLIVPVQVLALVVFLD